MIESSIIVLGETERVCPRTTKEAVGDEIEDICPNNSLSKRIVLATPLLLSVFLPLIVITCPRPSTLCN